jgi:GNAT superfamily N-acetyltransferase
MAPGPSLEDVVDVMYDAFYDYPVMRFVVGAGHRDYDDRLRKLIGFFVFRRVRHGGPLLGIRDGDRVVAAAACTLPVEPETPPDVFARRDALWRDLGDDTRARYDAYAGATKPFFTTEPHHHLNMIGVRHSHMGRGLARPILEAVAGLSQADPRSHGVSLTTELPKNLTLYEHFGHRIVRHARVADELETWGLYRPTDHQTRA